MNHAGLSGGDQWVSSQIRPDVPSDVEPEMGTLRRLCERSVQDEKFTAIYLGRP